MTNTNKNTSYKKEGNNSVPKCIFFPNKVNRVISIVLVIIIILLSLYYGINNYYKFTRDMLIDLINNGFTIALSIVALAITVFQTDKILLVKTNTNKNIKEIYLSYIFSIFPLILELLLGYLVAFTFEKCSFLLCLYFIITVLVLVKCITGTIASFVAFLNIR